jgi:hypothetical protein
LQTLQIAAASPPEVDGCTEEASDMLSVVGNCVEGGICNIGAKAAEGNARVVAVECRGEFATADGKESNGVGGGTLSAEGSAGIVVAAGSSGFFL